MKKVLEFEKKIGMETFFTFFEGVGGKLRVFPEDFVVKEISNYPPDAEDGKFAIADVTSVNWETNQLVKEISEKLCISRKRINFAGTKDKRAKTTQLMSFYNVDVESLSNVKLKNVEIKDIYRSNKPVKIGNLHGNKFNIIVRNIKSDVNFDDVEKISSLLTVVGGFPNFYGIQRFGVMRPITHVVGKHIVFGDFEKAVMSYVANPIEGEDEESFNARQLLEKNHDFSEAIKIYPVFLNYELAMLNRLVVYPDDFVGALNQLPQNLVNMFVYAYQSYLFNKILSERIRRKMPLNNAVIGDIVLPVRNNVIDETCIHVKDNNIEKVNKQISRGKAVVSGVLFGSDSVFSEGEMGEIEHKIIQDEKIDHRDFIIPDMPRLSSSGSRRSILGFVKNLEIKILNDDVDKANKLLNLSFELMKGCYATSLLREFMKTDNIRNY